MKVEYNELHLIKTTLNNIASRGFAPMVYPLVELYLDNPEMVMEKLKHKLGERNSFDLENAWKTLSSTQDPALQIETVEIISLCICCLMSSVTPDKPLSWWNNLNMANIMPQEERPQ